MGIKNRKFGVEMEFVGITPDAAKAALIAAGVCTRNYVTYDHQDSHTEWKVVTDGSVTPRVYGQCGEVVSPILLGEEGLEQVEKVCKAMSEAGATINRTCGLHVHVDAAGLSVMDVSNVVKRYARFESEIDSFMPPSRRGDEGSYCLSMRQWVSRLERQEAQCREPRQLASVVGQRYLKVNLQSLRNHGTIEFRQHSGSLNASKICNWVKFCVNFVEESRNGNATAGARRPGARESKTVTKMRQLAVYFDNNSYLSISDIANLIDVSQATVAVYISNMRKNYGFRITKNRYYGYRMISAGSFDSAQAVGGRGSRNPAARGRRTPRQAIAHTVSTPDSWHRGLDPEVISFYNERISEFGA